MGLQFKKIYTSRQRLHKGYLQLTQQRLFPIIFQAIASSSTLDGGQTDASIPRRATCLESATDVFDTHLAQGIT
jgi:hypothetical protein